MIAEARQERKTIYIIRCAKPWGWRLPPNDEGPLMSKPCFRDRDATFLCEDSKNKILYYRLAVLPVLLCSKTSRRLGTHDLICFSRKGWNIQKVLDVAMPATQHFRCIGSHDGCHLLDICYVPETVLGALCVFAHSINSNPLDGITKKVLLPPFHEKENWDLKKFNVFPRSQSWCMTESL